MPPVQPIEERLVPKIDFTQGDCWIWIGARQSRGYGSVHVRGRNQLAHRVVYEQLVGPIPPQRDVDHLCRNPSCVNPAHLEPVSHRENNLRGVGPIPENAAKTHCIYGHAFDKQNTRIYADGKRRCGVCTRARARRRRRAIREAELESERPLNPLRDPEAA